MTVTSSTSKSRATGNGVTTAFTGSFRILDESHVTVTHTSTVGVDTVKTITTDYTVSGVGGSSFTVTHLVAPASGVVVTLSRNVPATQELDLVENDDMPADELEKSFDKDVMLIQQIKEAQERSVRFPVSDSTARTAELPVAALRAGKVLAFDADGDVIVSTEDLDDIEGSITEAAASAAAAAASAAAAQTAETNAETAETAAEAAQAAAEAAAASVPAFPIDPADTTFAATARVLGRKTAGAGTGEEVTLSELLDFIGSAAQGDILYRGAASWARLAAGTSGHFLKTNGAAANPAWAAAAGGFSTIGYNEYTSNADITATIPWDDSIPQIGEGTQILSVTVDVPTATAEVIIMAQGEAARTSGTSTGIVALFNGGSNALRACVNYLGATTTQPTPGFKLVHRYVHGSVASVTYTIRIGPDTGTIRLNGATTGRYLGGASAANLLVFVREP
jgi:hypothetical protein